MRGDRKVRDMRTAINRSPMGMATLERGGYGVVIIVRVCLGRQRIVNDRLFLGIIRRRGKSLLATTLWVISKG